MRWLVACVGVGVVALMWLGPSAAASCAEMSEEQWVARAEVIFEGVAAGAGEPYDDDGGPGHLSTARFTVEGYEKGAGPTTVDVLTGERIDGDTVSGFSNGITVTEGDRWRIYGRWERDGLVATSACDGSRLVVAGVTSHAPALEEEVHTTTELDEATDQEEPADRGWLLPTVAALALAGGVSGAGLLRRR